MDRYHSVIISPGIGRCDALYIEVDSDFYHLAWRKGKAMLKLEVSGDNFLNGMSVRARNDGFDDIFGVNAL